MNCWSYYATNQDETYRLYEGLTQHSLLHLYKNIHIVIMIHEIDTNWPVLVFGRLLWEASDVAFGTDIVLIVLDKSHWSSKWLKVFMVLCLRL